MDALHFMDFNRISDDICWPCPSLAYRINANLYKSDKNGSRRFFHREYVYEKDRMTQVTIKRSYDYFLSLDFYSKEEKDGLMITTRDFSRFKDLVNSALLWFTDKKYSKLFVVNRNILTLTSPIPSCEINGLPAGKYLKIEPVIIDFGLALADKQPGVCLSMSENLSVSMTVDQYIGFVNSVNDTNMFLYAQGLVNSVNVPIGTNIIDLREVKDTSKYKYRNNNQEQPYNPINNGITGINGRFIGGKGDLL